MVGEDLCFAFVLESGDRIKPIQDCGFLLFATRYPRLLIVIVYVFGAISTTARCFLHLVCTVGGLIVFLALCAPSFGFVICLGF